MAATDWDEATFEAHRPLLFSIAYRMLGSASEAEDVMQDAWLRALQDEHSDVRSPRAYLTTIVTRLCIDRLRSAGGLGSSIRVPGCRNRWQNRIRNQPTWRRR
jgi:RNA polymerase sigma factor (sigma-70 family)